MPAARTPVSVPLQVSDGISSCTPRLPVELDHFASHFSFSPHLSSLPLPHYPSNVTIEANTGEYFLGLFDLINDPYETTNIYGSDDAEILAVKVSCFLCSL